MPKTYTLIKKLYNFDAWRTTWKFEKAAKDYIDIEARGPGPLPGLPKG